MSHGISPPGPVRCARGSGRANHTVLRLAGYHAMNTLRLEAGYRHWGHDITGDGHADRGRARVRCCMGQTLVQRTALPWSHNAMTALARSVSSRLRLEDPDRLLYHDEPIFRDGIHRRPDQFRDVELRRGPVSRDGLPQQCQMESRRTGSRQETFEIEVANERIPATAIHPIVLRSCQYTGA